MDILIQSPFRLAILGFCLGFGAGVLTGTVGFGQPWTETLASAIGIGIGIAVAFYLVLPGAVTRGR